MGLVVNIQPENVMITNSVAKFKDTNDVEQTFITQIINSGWDDNILQLFTQFQALIDDTEDALEIARIDSNRLRITLNIEADSNIKICSVYGIGVTSTETDTNGDANTKAGLFEGKNQTMIFLIVGGCGAIVCIFILCNILILLRNRKTSQELKLAHKTIQMLSVKSGSTIPSLNMLNSHMSLSIDGQIGTGHNKVMSTSHINDIDNQMAQLQKMKNDLMKSGHDGYNDEYRQNHDYLPNDALFAANVGFNEMQNVQSDTAGFNGENDNEFNGPALPPPVPEPQAVQGLPTPQNDGDYDETNDDYNDDDIYGEHNTAQ